MRLALIGLGRNAQHQLTAIARTHGVKVVDAYGLSPERGKNLGINVRFHPTLQSILKHSDADIFVISTLAHLEITRALLENGRAVLIDKPECVDNQELDSLATLANARNVFIYLAMHACFAPEVRWWLEQCCEAKYHLGELIRFESGCYDPYVIHGKIRSQAGDCRGSWFEGGSEALGVVGSFVDAESLEVSHSTLAKVPAPDNRDIRGKASFSFTHRHGCGDGQIETNWTLGLERKITRLVYEGGDIILHHSKEAVFLCRNGRYTLLKDLRNRLHRQTNRYCGLLADVRNRLKSSHGNMDYARPLHRLLFEAAEKGHSDRYTTRS